MDNSEQIVSLIAAVGRNGAIGLENRLLWSLPADMAYFKAVTLGRPVIMGRKTWESLPQRFRPLPGRQNVVVTRNTAYQAPGASLAHSLEEALALAGRGEVFVIGGADLYGQALVVARRLYLTEVDDGPKADAFFPHFDRDCWPETRRDGHPAEGGRPAFAFVVRERQE